MRESNRKDLIWLVFFNMMTEEKRLFKDIRVNEICEQANIHRSTFYRHFEDKYDLLEYGLGQLWQSYFEMDEREKLHSPFQTAAEFYQESQGKHLINHHATDAAFIETVNLFFMKQMSGKIKNELEKQPIHSIPIDLQVRFLIGTIEVVESWGKEQKVALSPKELDTYYEQLILTSLGSGLW